MALPRLLLLLGLLPYCAWLVGAYEFHLVDQVNLAVHETGHLLFTPFGQMMHMLGGTILQLAAPLVFAGHFLVRGRRFDAAVCVLWFAESLMYTAVYLGDAYLMQLPRVGGDIHDWNWLLGRVGWLQACEEIALGLHVLASVLAVGSVLVAGWVTLAEHRRGAGATADVGAA